MSDVLDPLTLPLRGSHLVEASAGTGKTWTIATLYVRLVLGHGSDAARYHRPLAPAEILVLTFTRAATRELSDRIRARLLQAARCFRGEDVGADPLLEELLDEHPPGPLRTAAAWRLSHAAEAMDDAAVFTIDAWCQRMLREHAFDSGSLFDEELVPDDTELRDEAVRDHWRQHVYPLSQPQLAATLSVWKDVDALSADMRNLLPHVPPVAGTQPLGQLLDRLMGEFDRGRSEWPARAEAMRAWLHAQCEARRFSAKCVRPGWFDPWLDALAAWAPTPDALRTALRKGATRLTPDGMADAWVGGDPMDLPADFEAFAGLMATPSWGPALRRHAAGHVGARLQALKRQTGRYGFEDLLLRLDAALSGPTGTRLRDRIVAQYPVALVDEFQDTSPVQYRLFDQLYRTASNDPATALLLIGDPKQSIYGFRGADIHSYLRARHDTAGRHHVLGTNHRSTAALVEAVNRLFARAEAREGSGAFLLRTPGADPVPYLQVKPRGRAERFTATAGDVPALTFALDPELLDGKASQRRFASACAERIVALLDDPAAGFTGPDGAFERLRPADLAVLVRTAQEAESVRLELRRRRVASVFLSDRDSVLASPEAADLLRWLRAVAAPLDTHLVRAALATGTMARTLAELAVLADDDTAFDQRTDELRRLHRTWLDQGVLTLLRQTLHVMDLPSRWLAQPDGERRLTNYLHLAELLQSASAHLDNEHALIRWLAERIDDPASGADEQIVRLESDADLVKVVTIHKSKGLEYPVVFLPFATALRGARAGVAVAVTLADEHGRRTLHLEASDEVQDRAEQERLREDVRLLYVALTRARHALWIGVAALRVGNGRECMAHRSAFGHVVAGGQKLVADDWMAAVEAMAAPQPDVRVEHIDPSAPRRRLRRGEQLPHLRDAAPYTGAFERSWSVSSFSAIVRHLGSVPLAALAAVVREDEVLSAEPPRLPLPADGAEPWHTFPRGALPGNFLHDQLEWLAGEGFDLASEARVERLRKRCERQGWGHRADDVVAWLAAVTTTALPPVGAPLCGLGTLLPEMEFWFPSGGVNTGEIDRLCQAHVLPGIRRPALPQRDLQGLLMGFSDLVFEQDGRYWVLDYKSNALGVHDADYTPGALAAAMAEHRYDVQAALYLLALHRLLRSRLGDGYDPGEHLGGAVYLFLRGIRGPASGVCHVAAGAEFLDALDAAVGPPPETGP